VTECYTCYRRYGAHCADPDCDGLKQVPPFTTPEQAQAWLDARERPCKICGHPTDHYGEPHTRAMATMSRDRRREIDPEFRR
jgi:hypothetical protein